MRNQELILQLILGWTLSKLFVFLVLQEIFVEPQGKRDLKDVMNGYYSRIVQPGSKGACFLAVCRGKVIISLLCFRNFTLKIIK